MQITADTLVCPDSYNLNNGLSITADNVVLDCANSNITGTFSGRGIDLSNVQGVVVENCNIASYESGIYLEKSNAILRNNALINNGIGIHSLNSEFSEENNVFIDNIKDEESLIIDEPPITPQEPETPPKVIAPAENITLPETTVEQINEPVPELINEPLPQDTLISNEDLLQEGLRLEYGNVSQSFVNKKVEDLRRTLKDVTIEREFVYSKSSTKVILTITPKKGFFKRPVFTNFTVYESIPKCFASLVNNIIFDETPEVLKPDPLVKKVYPKLEKSTSITYSSGALLTEECREFFKSIAISDLTNYATFGGDLVSKGPFFVIKTFPFEIHPR